ncbi:testis-specific serine/threonine-protein kinase 3-like [Wyeomyia smithii]|uniref:testis-specific serine/threonine-protein kinase 3-like n=1 Tax=Wyeomyia smithii TaxID=174621 RepID=UPI002467DE07|nr:testis-specific serine/threonine-protein kinase 3-like [Wyeomyia smithii]
MDTKQPETTTQELQSALHESRNNVEQEPTQRRESVLESNGYHILETIGKGAFSIVKKAFSKAHNRVVAIKTVSKQKATTDVLNKFLPREIDLVKGLKHTNLIRFYECIETTLRFYIIMQYAENGSLLQLIRKEKILPEAQAKHFFNQLINAVEYIHSMGVVHRDIKCENIVFDENFTLKLIDFGFARGNMQPVIDGGKIKPVLSKTFCGSHAYASPEILKSIPYQPQLSDIWATGVVLYTMVIGRLPFSNEENVSALIKQVFAGPKFPKDRCISDECKDIIIRILRPAHLRISISDMRRLPWFNEDDSGYDDSGNEKSLEKKMRLDESVNDRTGTGFGTTDMNNNIGTSPVSTSASVYNRKKAVPDE